MNCFSLNSLSRFCRGRALTALTLLGCLAVSTLSAQAQEGEPFQMPTDPSVWLNSSPITSEMLAGKAAVLYFYEET